MPSLLDRLVDRITDELSRDLESKWIGVRCAVCSGDFGPGEFSLALACGLFAHERCGASDPWVVWERSG